jgi:hypothetical protein
MSLEVHVYLYRHIQQSYRNAIQCGRAESGTLERVDRRAGHEFDRLDDLNVGDFAVGSESSL